MTKVNRWRRNWENTCNAYHRKRSNTCSIKGKVKNWGQSKNPIEKWAEDINIQNCQNCIQFGEIYIS